MKDANDLSAPKDFLSEEFEGQFHFEYATPGQRFVNFVVDFLVMRFLLGYVTGLFVQAILVAMAVDFLSVLATGAGLGAIFIVFLLIAAINTIVYYTICEKLFKGYTIGKAITGTRAVREDGGELKFINALARSICRIIPFEVLSGFAKRPWHDTLTGTMVVKVRK